MKNQELLELVKKYNVSGPRYTSYPTAVQFTEQFDPAELQKDFERRRRKTDPLSLYIHIPFCFSLCWYCGCTKIITRDQDRGDHYLDYLEIESRLTAETVHPEAPLKQIHFGGGTPTFLTPDQLRRLGTIIRSHFTIHPEVEFSVEIDPRRVSEDHILALKEIGVNRASLGVQDTNPDVQEAIHRIQPFEQTTEITQFLRKHGITDINFDLIYGLPRQTPSTFKKTIEDVMTLEPDRLAIYSYAHIPSMMPAQKLLNEDEFPSTEEKLGMLVYAIDTLPEYGFRYIGMDHFARTGDALSKALDNGTLQRNFQGYSTHAELEMLALGMSGISQNSDLYIQNEKDLAKYYEKLDSGELPVKKVLRLTDEDKLRRKIIMQIMCKAEISFRDFETENAPSFKENFAEELSELEKLEADGFLLILDDKLIITEQGRLFLRNVAMVFDGYINSGNHKTAYSKTV